MKKTHVNSNVDLNTLAGGAFAEKVNEAVDAALKTKDV